MNISQNKAAVVWSGIEKFSTYALQFLITVVLGRLLSPDDYAVVAMLGIFFSISQAFIDSGMTSSLIQKKNCSQDDFNSVYYFNIIVSFLCYAVIFIAAPYIEKFYGYQDLATVTRIYSLTLVIAAFSRVHYAIFCKELKFRQMAKISLHSALASSVAAIVMAYFGMKYWSLVGQGIVGTVVITTMTCYTSKWRPTFSFSLPSLRSLAPLGLSILFISIFHAIYNNIYSFIIGKFKTAQELGYYDRARALGGFIPIGLSDLLTKALMPVQSKQQDDEQALQSSYLRAFDFVCVIIIPICLFVSFYSKETIVFLLGEKWVEAGNLVTFIAIGYLFYPLQNININMLKVKAKGKSLMKSEILKKVVGIIIVCITINFNLTVVAIGWMCFALFEFAVSLYFLKYSINIPAASMFKSFCFVFTKATIALAVSLLHKILNCEFYISFILANIAFAGIYLVLNIKFVKTEFLTK